MFILGYEEENPPETFLNLVSEGLGGVIFFTRNIKTREQFKQDINLIKECENPDSPLFLSIDQEGGRVERTLNIHGGQKYLCAREAAKKGEDFVKAQTLAIAKELKDFGLNMNFAPVLDVDTNPDNPVIAERSYSNDPDVVAKLGTLSAKVYLENGIIPVGKHFPGHGDTAVDSHLAMPESYLSLKELEATHIAPFKQAIDSLPAIMVAHVYYSAFDAKPFISINRSIQKTQKLPASISKTVIEDYLRGKLGFDGLVISDDMVMGGVKNFTPFEAVKRGIEAGINMFIFRNADEQTISLIQQVEDAVRSGEIDERKIDESIQRIKFITSEFQHSNK